MKIKSVKYNFLMDFILKVSAFVFPLITFPYASRILSPEGIGKVSFATSVIAYFQMVSCLGIPTYGIRVCAKVRNDKNELSHKFQELFILNLFITLFVYGVFFVMLNTVKTFQQEKVLLIIASTNIVLNTIGVSWLYTALEQYQYITVRSLFFKVFSVVALFALVHSQEDYIIYAGISVLSSAGSNILNIIHVRKYIFFRKQKKYHFKEHIRPILVLFAMCAAGSIYTNLDTVMLGFLSNNEQVGYYSAAIKVKNIMVSFVISLGGVMLPRLIYYIQNGLNDAFNKMSAKAFNFILYTSIPLTVYFSIYAKESIAFLSGDKYYPAIITMQLLMPTIVFIGLTNMMGYQILVPTNRESKVLLSVVIGAITDTILNALLIPQYGATGAAIGTLIAEFSVLVVQVYLLWDYLAKIRKEIKINYIIGPLLFASVAAFGIKFLNFENPLIKLILSSCIFFGIYLLGFLIEKEPISMQVVTDIGSKCKAIRRRYTKNHEN